MRKSVLKGVAFANAAMLDRNQLKKVRGGQVGDEPSGDGGRCANTGAVCWFDGAGGDSVVGQCEEMGSGQCRCVARDKTGTATESVPFQECLG